jgi:hypothetical protein
MWITCFVVAASIVLEGIPAEAFQSHPAPEGLYVHQLAHMFFVVAMAILAYWLQVNRFAEQRGWRLIQAACLLFILWNLDTILGHWVEEKIPSEALLGEPDWTQRISLAVSPWVPAYYLLKLDHLVCVPAVGCLMLGVRSLYRNALKEEGRADD